MESAQQGVGAGKLLGYLQALGTVLYAGLTIFTGIRFGGKL
jgi:hypothetical protein